MWSSLIALPSLPRLIDVAVQIVRWPVVARKAVLVRFVALYRRPVIGLNVDLGRGGGGQQGVKRFLMSSWLVRLDISSVMSFSPLSIGRPPSIIVNARVSSPYVPSLVPFLSLQLYVEFQLS